MAYKRRLYYFPGLISLIGLFIFFVWNQNKYTPKETSTLSLNVPSDKKPDSPYESPFSSFSIQKYIQKKKQIRLTLDDDKKTNQKKLEFIQFEARRLKYTMDTTTVINVNLSNEITYGEFIQLLEICYSDQHKIFVPLKNSFIIFGESPLKKIKRKNDFVTLFGNDNITIHPLLKKMSLIEKIASKIKSLKTKENILLISGWVILVSTFLYFLKRKAIIIPPLSTL
jgi:hypothetical protein